MDLREAMIKDTATLTVLPQQSVAFILRNPSQTDILEAPDPTGYITLPPLPSNDVHAGMGSLPFQDSRFSNLGGLASTRVSIQDLSELVKGFNDKWLQRLDSAPHLVSRCSNLASPDVFSRGIRAMQQCFKDPLSASFEDMSSGHSTDCSNDDFDSQTGRFEDVFSNVVLYSVENIISLMHVACACAYLLHKDEYFYDWDGLFHHMPQWQHLLWDQDDVQCFSMAMDQLTHTYPLTIRLSGGGSYDQQPYGRTFDVLMDGPVMRDCSMFLDGLECQRLYERNENGDAQYFNRAIDMIDSITTPLRDNPHTEGFLSVIAYVELQLHAGLLHNPREVEVMLIINGRNYAGSSEAFENYKMAVIASCDRAMKPLGPSWRNKYYTVAIDWVRAVSVEIGNHQKQEKQSARQDTSVLAVGRPYQFDEASPLSVTSAEREPTDDIPQSTSPSTLRSTSPSTSGPETPVSSLSTDGSDSYSTSPTTASAGSPTLHAPQNPAADVIRCHLCIETFFDRANLRRHLTSSNAHGPVSKIPCPMAGCPKSYTRLDNLRAHIYKRHGESLPVSLQHRGATK